MIGLPAAKERRINGAPERLGEPPPKMKHRFATSSYLWYMARHTDIPDELKREITKAIYEATDLGEAILKGHLYVEFVLNEVFLSKWPDSGKPLVERFGFDQKLTIAEATQIVSSPWALGSMRALNRIRNLYAHSLIPAGIENHIADMPLLDPNIEHRAIDPLPKVKIIVLSLCSFLAGRMNSITGIKPMSDWLVIGSWVSDTPQEEI